MIQDVPPKRFISLRTKFIVFISFIIIGVCSGLSFYVIQQQAAFMAETLQKTGVMMVKNLAHNSRYSLITHDQLTLERLIEGAMTIEEVVYVVMTDSQGKTLMVKTKNREPEADGDQAASLTKGFLPTPQIVQTLLAKNSTALQISVLHFHEGTSASPSPQNQQGARPFDMKMQEELVFDFAVPIRRKIPTEPVFGPLSFETQETEAGNQDALSPSLSGVVQVGLTNRYMLNALNTVIGHIALITILIILAGIGMTTLLANRIITPLQNLAGMARRIGKGDLTAVVPSATSDEVGQLSDIFNSMTKALQERQQAISAQMETIQRQVNQLKSLNQTGVAITSNLDLDKLLSTVLQLLVNQVAFTHMMLFLYDEGRNLVYGVETAGIPEHLAQKVRNMHLPVQSPDSIHSRMVMNGESFFIPIKEDKIQDIDHSLFQVLHELRIQSFVCAPLRSQQHILGFILADKTPHFCSQEDLDLLVTIANTIGVAIDNAKTYHQLEQFSVTLEHRVMERTQELQEANTKLQELDRLKSAFVSIVSHELRTPMTSIKGLVENMLDGLTGPLTDRQEFYLGRVRVNIDRLTRMINDLLDLSRIEGGGMQLRLTPLCLPELITEVFENMQFAAQEKSLALELRTQGSVPDIQGDRDKVSQMLTNLIHNAIKFTAPGGSIVVEVLQLPNGYLQICITDTGCGIPEKELTTIFDRFYRSKSTPLEAQGAGLGLAITKNLIELHGGSIWVKSVVGKGSQFYFTLPT